MKIVFTRKAPEPIGPYSQGVESDNFVFLSGQIGLNPDTGTLTGDLVQQTRQVMKNILALLEAAGCTFLDVVRSTIYLKNMDEFETFNKVYSEYFKENPPARTTVEVSALPRNALVEIDIVAHK
jgi:2-iminobutanoate/2-iminopropanoate deaminase